MIKPELLCNKHLLGSHGELHKFHHNFVKQHNIKGRIFPIVQIEPESMKIRHDELAEEMSKRGMNHKSPYNQPDLNYLQNELRYAKVNKAVSIKDLIIRCGVCCERILKGVCKI